MLIARAPVRISFAGGGTDLPAYYERYGGMVVSTSIAKYFYAILGTAGHGKLQITSADYHTFYRHKGEGELFWDGDLALPKAVLHQFGINRGLSMFLASEVPPGTGLGSSSAVAVGIVKALAAITGGELSRQDIAELAAYIEIEKLGMPIGRQDQYAAAFGGINAITFSESGVTVEPLAISPATVRELEARLMLFFTGSSRNSASILREQKESSEKKRGFVVESLHAMKEMAREARRCLETGDLSNFGELLHKSWEQKKSLASGITNSFIDECYATARMAGAGGGKITGAGGGGFLMLYCEEPYQETVTRVLEQKGLAHTDFAFDSSGAEIIMDDGRRLERLSSLSLPWIEEKSA